MSRKMKVLIGVVILVLGGIGISGLLGANQSASAKSVVAGPKGGQMVKVGDVAAVDIQSKVASSGVLEAESFEAVYAETNNQVANVHKKVGDVVKKGDVIISFEQDAKDKQARELEKITLQLETAQLALRQIQTASKGDILTAQTNVATMEKMAQDGADSIEQTKRSLITTKKDLETVEKDYTVTKQLFDKGLASETEVTKSKQSVDNLKDKLTGLEDNLKSLQKDQENNKLKHENAVYSLNVLLNQVDDASKTLNITMKQNDIKNLELQKQTLLDEMAKTVTQVVAPKDGVISELTIENGQMVASGVELFKIIDPSVLIVKGEVSPYYATQLKPGLEAIVKYSGSTVVEIKGEVTRIAPVAQTKTNGTNQTTTLPIEVAITGDMKGLKPGLVVDVKIIADDVKGVTAVPLLATMEDKEGEVYLFVVKDDFTLEKRAVKQGASNNAYVEVSNVAIGEKVVTNPTEALDNGTIVNYENAAAEEGVAK